MNVYLTLDYELYFGHPTGTVEKCLIEPTNELIRISRNTGINMTFFIDVGFIIQLEKHKTSFYELEKQYVLIVNQIKELIKNGHDCQLHIHPHWEDSSYDGKSWQIDISRYKLTDFSENEISTIFKSYTAYLEKLTGKNVNTYRAGGWCLQPFDKIKKVFEQNGIKIDSTVYKGGYNTKGNYFYDFRQTPEKTRWRFTNDLTEEDPNGVFLEIPISTYKYNPMFFWRLFGWGRINPGNHKPIGNGKPVSGGGSKKDLLFSSNQLPVSLDGFFATKLGKALRKDQKAGKGNDFVVIGHPKACTYYSLKVLERFIKRYKKDHKFCTLSSQLE